MHISEKPYFCLSPLIELAYSIQAQAKMDRIVKGFLFISAGVAVGTLAIAKATVLSPRIVLLAIITSLAMISLALKSLILIPKKIHQNDGIDHTITLPAELLLKIFEYIPAKASGNLSAVCQRWNDLEKDNVFWKLHFERDFQKPLLNPELAKDEYASMTPLPFLRNLIKDKWTKFGTARHPEAVAVSPDEQTVICAYYSDLHFKNRNKDRLRIVPLPINAHKIEYSKDGTKIICIGEKVVILNANREILRVFDIKLSGGGCEHTKVHHVISPNGNKIILWDNPRAFIPFEEFPLGEAFFCSEIEIADINSKDNFTFTFDLVPTDKLQIAAFSYDETKIIIAFKDIQANLYVQIWDLESKTKIQDFSSECFSDVTSLAFSPSGEKIVIGGYVRKEKKCQLALYHVMTGKQLQECFYDARGEHSLLLPYSIEILAGDTWAIVSNGEPTFCLEPCDAHFYHHQLWNLKSGTLVHTFEGFFTSGWKVKAEWDKSFNRNLYTCTPHVAQKPKSLWERLFGSNGSNVLSSTKMYEINA